MKVLTHNLDVIQGGSISKSIKSLLGDIIDQVISDAATDPLQDHLKKYIQDIQIPFLSKTSNSCSQYLLATIIKIQLISLF
jgi:hypothetical protein